MWLRNFVFLVNYYVVSNVVGLGAVSCMMYYNNLPSLHRAATNPGPPLMRVLCSPDSSPVFPGCVKMLLGESSLLSSNHSTDMLTQVSLFISPSPTHTHRWLHTPVVLGIVFNYRLAVLHICVIGLCSVLICFHMFNLLKHHPGNTIPLFIFYPVQPFHRMCVCVCVCL